MAISRLDLSGTRTTVTNAADDPDQDPTAVGRNLARYLVPATNMAILVVGVATSIMLARLLGASGRGLISAWQTWATAISNFSNFGIAQAIVTTSAFGVRLPRRQFAFIIGVIVTNTLLLSAAVIPWVIGGVVPTWTAVLFAASNAVSAIVPPLFQRLKLMAIHFNLVRFIPGLANLATIMTLWYGQVHDPLAVMVAMSVVQVIVMAIIALLVAWRYTGAGTLSRSFAIEALRLAPPRWTLYVFTTVDMLVVTLVFPHAQIAFYGVALSLQAAIVSLGYTVSARWFSEKQAKLLPLPRTYLRELFVLCVPPAIGVILFGYWLIPLFFGTEFSAAVWASRILAVGGVVRAIDNLYWYQCLSHVPARLLTISRVVAIVINAVTVFAIGLGRPPAALELAAATTVLVASGSALCLMIFDRRFRAQAAAGVTGS